MVTKEQLVGLIWSSQEAAMNYVDGSGAYSNVLESAVALRSALDELYGAVPAAQFPGFVHTDAVEGEKPSPITETTTWAPPAFFYPYPDVVNPAPADDISIVDTASRQLEVKREYYDELVDLYFARLNAGEDEWTARQTVNDAISFLADLNKDLDC